MYWDFKKPGYVTQDHWHYSSGNGDSENLVSEIELKFQISRVARYLTETIAAIKSLSGRKLVIQNFEFVSTEKFANIIPDTQLRVTMYLKE